MQFATVTEHSYRDWTKRLPRHCLVDRDAAILELCRGKSVLHLGAADAPFHKEKARDGSLLHQKVSAVASKVLGIDHDKEAVEWLRREHGISNISVIDATQMNDKGGNYDIVLCCDIIEHVVDVSGLIRSCRQYMNPETTLLISTINALGLKMALRALLGYESVHNDHTAYYSFGTLCQLVQKCGLRPTSYATFSYSTVTRLSRMLFGSIARISPSTADGVIVTATI